MDKEELVRALSIWDGQHTDYLMRIHQAFFKRHADLQVLIDLLQQNPELQVPLSWWLKYSLEQGCSVDQDKSSALIQSGIQFEHWQAILHFLQSLPYLEIPQPSVMLLESGLQRWLMHDNKFIRAWCYNAWHLLADRYPEYRERVAMYFDMARRDEAASVQARIRQIEKDGLWSQD